MKTAISMYLGGDELTASQADHNTSKDFGLVCPCCREPVIYCAGSYHEATSKRKAYTVEAYFSHYAKNLSNSVCEERIKTDPSVRDRIQREASQGKNQRLKLYQKRLRDIYRLYYIPVVVNEERDTKLLKEYLGQKPLKFAAKEACKDWKKQLEEAREAVANCCDNTNSFDSSLFKSLENKLEAERVSDYRNDITKQALHKKICLEIVQFLATKPSHFFWKTLILELILYKSVELKITYGQYVAQGIRCDDLFTYSTLAISDTRWIDAIAHFLSQK